MWKKLVERSRPQKIMWCDLSLQAHTHDM